MKAAPFYLREFDQTYNEKGLAQSKLWPPGTLCITIAANIADTAILAMPACFPDSIIGFTADPKKSDAKYVKYCLDTYKQRIRAISQGTTQDNLSVEKLLSFRFRIPDCAVQKKIAAVLSAYDDLIENSRRRIALLERMAEQLYREWFVRFRFPGYQQAKFEKGVPFGWTVTKLGELYRTASGGTPSRASSGNYGGRINWLKTGELKQLFVLSTAETITEQGMDSSSAKVFPRQTVVMAMYCAMPDVSLLAIDAATNQACCALLPKKDYLYPSFTYFLAKYALAQMVTFAHGAAQQNLSQDTIKKFQVLVPQKSLIERYLHMAAPIFDQIEVLLRMSEQLVKTRDLLLPRLISGKLRVDELDIQFPPSMQAG
ncbi:type I restriction-modification system specificity subunit [Rhodanobacter denitrificans]|nr:type I restriction-modification system specificity subunit [Rhodanobacter denitrificans]